MGFRQGHVCLTSESRNSDASSGTHESRLEKAPLKSICRTALVGLILAIFMSGATPVRNSPNTGMADPAALINAFDKFLKGVPSDGSQVLTMPLVALRGITSESMNASGRVMINLSTGLVTSNVRGLPPDGAFDLWLIGNRPAPGHTTM